MHSVNTSSKFKDINKKSYSRRSKHNIFSRIFLGYQSCECKFYSSTFYRFFSYLKHRMSWVARLKHSIADKTEDSFLYSKISSLFGSLITVPMRSYGIMMFIFGLITLLIEIFKFSSLHYSLFEGSVLSVVFNAVLIFSVAAFFTASSKSFGNVIFGSALFSWLLFDILNLDAKRIPTETKLTNNLWFSLLGGALAILSVFIRPLFIFLLLFTLVALYIVVKNPESGIILTILLMPFLSDFLLIGLASAVCLSVFLKVIRNKRVMKFELPDIFVFLLLFVVFISGFNGISHMGSLTSFLRITVIFVFGWVVNNTIKTTVLAEKCVNAFVFSLTILSVIGVFLSLLYFYDLESKYKIFEILGDILRGMTFSANSSSVQMVVIAVPFVFSSRKRIGFKGLISSLICVLFIVLSCDMSAWIALLTAIMFYFSMMYPILFLYFGVVISLFVGIYCFFPGIFTIITEYISTVTNHSAYVGDFSSFSNYGLTGMKEFMFSGAGVGQNTMEHVFKCIFGYGADVVSTDGALYVQMVLRIGLIGLLLCILIYCLVLSNCLSLYYKDKICKDSLRCYVLSCLAACSTVFISGLHLSGYLSSNVMMFIIMIIYLSFSFRKCSEIEFTPEAYDIESYRDVV